MENNVLGRMSYVKSAAHLVYYVINLLLLLSLLSAAFFLAQGLFGEYYACNERAEAFIEEMYRGGDTRFCLVLLNYTVSAAEDPEMPITLHQFVQMPCASIQSDPYTDPLGTSTSICYNRYNPQVFAPIANLGGLDAMYTHADAVRDLHYGYRAALWMALFAFLAAALHKQMDSLDYRCERLAKSFWQVWGQSRSHMVSLRTRLREKYMQWRRSRRRELDSTAAPALAGEQELQEIRTEGQPAQ